MPESTSNHRIRINAEQDAKGFYKIECTAEFDSVEEASANVAAGILAARESMSMAGLKFLSDPQ